VDERWEHCQRGCAVRRSAARSSSSSSEIARSAPVLRTTVRRITLAAREGGARLTIDLGVTLATMDGRAVRMRDGLALVETKSEDGDSPADGVLREFGAERLSLSKYRTGVDALLRRDESGEVDQARSLFAGGLPASASD
jgi:hypothetical protein